MNKARKTRVRVVIGELNNILDEEEMVLENTPESLQSSLRYEESEAASENLQIAIDALQEIIDY